MARRHGPQLQNLMYDRASAADDLMRSEAADSIKARSGIAPATGRINSRIPYRRSQQNHLAAGGVHRLSYRA